MPVLLPDRILAYLFDTVGIDIPQSTLAQYWKHCKEFFLSLVLWRPKSTRMSQFLLWSLNGDRSLGWKSHNPLYLAVVKSLNKAFDGFTWEGAQLNRKFCVTQIKGDWEYHWQTWRLNRYYKTRFICWRCDAENHTNAAHSVTDVSENPSWHATELSHNQFVVEGMQDNHVCDLAATTESFVAGRMESAKNKESNNKGPLLGLRSFHFSMLCHCSLHNVNLGLAQDATGSTLIPGF